MNIRIPLAPRLSVVLCAAVLLVACTGRHAPLSSATVTPLSGLTTSPRPTSTLVPRVVAIEQLPEMQEARLNFQAGNYDFVISLLHQLHAQYADSVEVQQLLASSYLVVGLALLKTANGDQRHAGEALDNFTSGLAVAPANSEVRGQLQREVAVALSLLGATAQEVEQHATPAPPTATPIAVAVRQVPDIRGADPGRARRYLRELGFTRIAMTQIHDQAQLGGLCKGMVAYTAPAGGSRIAVNQLVRIFYRGWDNFSSPADCPPGH